MERHAEARNARGVDILAYSADASRFLALQVKALSKRDAVHLGPSVDKCMGDFWVIVNKVATDTPSAFVMTPEEVKKRAVCTKTGPVQYFLQPPSYDLRISENDGTASAAGVLMPRWFETAARLRDDAHDEDVHNTRNTANFAPPD